MEDIRAAIAANITELRQTAGMTQSALAEKLNYSDKAISKWERAEAVPDVAVLKQIADYFGVSVDYLLTRKHGDDANPNKERIRAKRKNRVIISALSVMLVWFLAAVAFTVLSLCDTSFAWFAFVTATPVCVTVALVFNSIWGNKRLNFLIITFLLWTLIASVHVGLFAFGRNNIWQLYLIGVPAQLIIILSGFIKFKKK